MAGDWIKMRVDLADDPAVIGMAIALGIDEYGVVGRLHKLWSWADKHCTDGHAKSVTSVWVDRYIGLVGFTDAIAKEGWLVVSELGVEFPKFDRHNGASAKTRIDASERKRLQRIREKEDAESGQVSHKKRDKAVTREEKRREEETSMSDADAPDGDGKSDDVKVERRRVRRGSDADYECAEFLFKQQRKANPTCKAPNFDTWANDIRLMREQDGRQHRDICELFKWAKADDFWSPNIQSPAKLREKWDVLHERRTREVPAPAPVKRDWE